MRPILPRNRNQHICQLTPFNSIICNACFSPQGFHLPYETSQLFWSSSQKFWSIARPWRNYIFICVRHLDNGTSFCQLRSRYLFWCWCRLFVYLCIFCIVVKQIPLYFSKGFVF